MEYEIYYMMPNKKRLAIAAFAFFEDLRTYIAGLIAAGETGQYDATKDLYIHVNSKPPYVVSIKEFYEEHGGGIEGDLI